MKTISVILVMFLLSDVIAQEDSLFVCRENQLVLLLNNLRTATKNSEKESNNKVFKEYLLETIKIKNAINYPFSKLTGLILRESYISLRLILKYCISSMISWMTLSLSKSTQSSK